MKGKIAIVTGANSGIGFEVTKALSSVGFHIVLGPSSISNPSHAVLHISSPSYFWRIPSDFHYQVYGRDSPTHKKSKYFLRSLSWPHHLDQHVDPRRTPERPLKRLRSLNLTLLLSSPHWMCLTWKVWSHLSTLLRKGSRHLSYY